MTKFNIMIAALGLTLIAGTANAGLLKTIATSGWETKPSAKYKVSTAGYDVRVYEWTPADNENVRCVFVAGADGNGNAGVACYEILTTN